MNEELANLSCEIIATVGSAKGQYIEAIQLAKMGQVEEAKQCLDKGEQDFLKGHDIHRELLSKMANGEDIKVDLLLVHAECQMMSAEDFLIIANEVIDFMENKSMG